MNKKMLAKNTVFVLVIVILIIVLQSLAWEFITNLTYTPDTTPLVLPERQSKILLVAPHNDDESLGASMFVKKAIENNCRVKLVMITNGDGYSEAAHVYYRKLSLVPDDFIDFGYKRQKETIDAMTSLGVKRDDIHLLGYPDGGIDKLWLSNFSVPYKSKRTEVSKSPYDNSYTDGVEYTGENLVKDLKSIVDDYKPDYIVYPHPNDRHPDHYTTNYFMKYTISNLNYKLKGELLYLVHRGDWPVPLMRIPTLSLKPPFKLRDNGTDWYDLPLDEKEELYKEEIIRKYKTQFPTLKSLLLAFIRKNELFGIYPNAKLYKGENSDKDIVPKSQSLIVTDPRQDTIRLAFAKGADITGLYSELSKEDNLNIILETDKKIEKLATYTIDLVVLTDHGDSRILLEYKDGKIVNSNLKDKSLEDITVKSKNNLIYFVIPFKEFKDYDSILINASTTKFNKVFDITTLRAIN